MRVTGVSITGLVWERWDGSVVVVVVLMVVVMGVADVAASGVDAVVVVVVGRGAPEGED